MRLPSMLSALSLATVNDDDVAWRRLQPPQRRRDSQGNIRLSDTAPLQRENLRLCSNRPIAILSSNSNQIYATITNPSFIVTQMHPPELAPSSTAHLHDDIVT